jgi:hypothetical protein
VSVQISDLLSGRVGDISLYLIDQGVFHVYKYRKKCILTVFETKGFNCVIDAFSWRAVKNNFTSEIFGA